MSEKPQGGIYWAVLVEPIAAKCRIGGEVDTYVHHITLGLKHRIDDYAALEGQEFDVAVRADCWSEDKGVQALAVDLPPELEAMKAAMLPKLPHSHLTLFCRQGVKPFASNTMLAGEHLKAAPATSTIRVRVEWCPQEEIDQQQRQSMLAG